MVFDYGAIEAAAEENLSDSDGNPPEKEIPITCGGIRLSNPVPVDEVPEEWDRFESLHDDPYNVGRSANKSLKYESKCEPTVLWSGTEMDLAYFWTQNLPVIVGLASLLLPNRHKTPIRGLA